MKSVKKVFICNKNLGLPEMIANFAVTVPVLHPVRSAHGSFFYNYYGLPGNFCLAGFFI